MRWFWNHYANPTQRLDPRASPLLANDLSGLPPAMIMTAEYDPLRDEGIEYAGRLKEAGVAVEFCNYEGMIHGFVSFANAVDQGMIGIEHVARALRGTFAAN